MSGYTTRRAAQLAGLSYRQLDYMTREGVVEPSLPHCSTQGVPLFGDVTGSGTARRWSERDVRLLRVLGTLRGLGVGTERLRDVVRDLDDHQLEGGWLIVNTTHVRHVDSIRKLGTLVAALAPVHVVELHPLSAVAA